MRRADRDPPSLADRLFSESAYECIFVGRPPLRVTDWADNRFSRAHYGFSEPSSRTAMLYTTHVRVWQAERVDVIRAQRFPLLVYLPIRLTLYLTNCKVNPDINLVFMTTHAIDESKYFGEWGETLEGYKARDPAYLEPCKVKVRPLVAHGCGLFFFVQNSSRWFCHAFGPWHRRTGGHPRCKKPIRWIKVLRIETIGSFTVVSW